MRNIFKIVLFIFFSMTSYSQNLKILKDSVFIDSSYFLIEELKIDLKDEFIINKIYKITQNAFDVFYFSHPTLPEERIKMKKDTITSYLQQNQLRESNAGFEHYEIYYDKNNIINISISLQSYGSSWEAIQYYCFDLYNGKRIGSNLFVNQQMLLKKIKSKLKDQDVNLSLKLNDLLNFKLITDRNKVISGIDFFIFDTKRHANSGYQEYIVHFDWKEISKYTSPSYKKRLF